MQIDKNTPFDKTDEWETSGSTKITTAFTLLESTEETFQCGIRRNETVFNGGQGECGH